MNSRKRSGSPYSVRHVRRLVVAEKASVLKEVNEDFIQHLGSCKNEQIENCDGYSLDEQKNYELKLKNIEHSTFIEISPVNDDDHSINPVHDNNVENNIVAPLEVDIDEKKQSDCDDISFIQDISAVHTENDCESDSEEFEIQVSSEKEKKNLMFVNNMRNIFIKYIHTAPHVMVNDILTELRNNTDAPFPKNARTLLKTPRSTKIYTMETGQYFHYGIRSAITTFITVSYHKAITLDCIDLLVNIDGAPLAKSSEKGLWIISCSENTVKEVAVIGIYHGEDKPSDCNILLKMFCEEMTFLINNSIEYKGKTYAVKFHALVCDVPAKAYVLNVKYHTGYNSCTKCDIEGDYQHNKVCFPARSGALRTDEGFQNYLYVDYQHGRTILSKIPNFGCVTNVVIDYMHLICLGVMLKMIELWINGPTNVKLSDLQREDISDRLVNLKKFTPSDFSRAPRQFKNVRHIWKAHEFRQFLLYSGPVVLFGILHENLYSHFLCLHVAITILVNSILVKNDDYLNFAETLLIHFVNDFEKLYGTRNMTHNVHNLLHVVQDVRNFGALDVYSAFKYENHIRKVKALVRKGDKPLQQIARRLAEVNASKEYEGDNNNYNDNNDTLLRPSRMSQFYTYQKNTLKINCLDKKNNCVLLKNGTYIECSYFIYGDDDVLFVVGIPLTVVKNLYCTPIRSSILNINVVKCTSKMPEKFLFSKILAKVCKIPFDKDFVVVPLSHTYES